MFVAAGAYTVALPYGGPLTYGKCVIMTSPDGNNWQLQDAGYNADLKGITWSGKNLLSQVRISYYLQKTESRECR